MVTFTADEVWLLVGDVNSPLLQSAAIDSLRWRVLIGAPLPTLLHSTCLEQPRLIVVELALAWELDEGVKLIRALRGYRSKIPLVAVAPRQLRAWEATIRAAGAIVFATYRAELPDGASEIVPLVEAILDRRPGHDPVAADRPLT